MSTTTAVTAVSALADQLAEWEQAHEWWRGHQTVNLNAATNTLSPRARAALASSSADKGISSGRLSRHHMGGRYIDLVEGEIERVACELFHAGAADLRPMSGSLANAIVLAAALPAGGSVLASDAGTLGHLSYRQEGWSGRIAASVVPMPFEPTGIDLDLAAIEATVRRDPPAMIFVGSQVMLFPVDLAGLRRIADGVGATIVYDAAHPLGLIAGGRFQDPLTEGADFITASTQKTLPGPVGGIILSRTVEQMAPIYSASNALLSNYQNNRVLSLGYTLLDMVAFGPAYADSCISNAQHFAAALAGSGLVPLFADRGYTLSNQLLLDWGTKERADAFAQSCEDVDIIVSTTRLPAGDGRIAYGTRLGLQDLTRRGVAPDALAELARLLAAVGLGQPLGPIKEQVRAVAADLGLAYSV
jgi:glycine hydroxymethyltransferase